MRTNRLGFVLLGLGLFGATLSSCRAASDTGETVLGSAEPGQDAPDSGDVAVGDRLAAGRKGLDTPRSAVDAARIAYLEQAAAIEAAFRQDGQETHVFGDVFQRASVVGDVTTIERFVRQESGGELVFWRRVAHADGSWEEHSDRNRDGAWDQESVMQYADRVMRLRRDKFDENYDGAWDRIDELERDARGRLIERRLVRKEGHHELVLESEFDHGNRTTLH